jgi:hypothetical protein
MSAPATMLIGRRARVWPARMGRDRSPLILEWLGDHVAVAVGIARAHLAIRARTGAHLDLVGVVAGGQQACAQPPRSLV